MINPLSTEDKLNERIKELSCLYGLLTVMQKDLPLEEALPQFAAIISKAFVYAPDAIAELKWETLHFFSHPPENKTVCLQNELMAFNETIGFVRVHYASPQYDENAFIPEEVLLLHKVAAEISNFCEKKMIQERNLLFERNAAHLDRLSILGEITAGIAHELNTPLGNILGFAELIQKQNSDAQTRHDISKIIKSAIHSREIVKKLMFFSCDMPQHIELVKTGPLFSQAVALLGPHFKKAKIEATLTFEYPDIEARVDSVQFTQVLFNILINSIYASAENTAITIAVGRNANDLYFEIADQGAGIPDGIKPKIFEPFFTTKPVGEGTGLGLSVVHGIIKSHSGSISVRDNVPSGTVFCIRLPLNSKPWP